MSVLPLEDLLDVVETTMDDEAVQKLIDREEAWLARQLKGALVGDRTARYWIRDVDLDNPLDLMRPTDEVAVSDFGTDVDADLIRLLGNGTRVERADGPWLGPWVEVTYEPNDLLEVQRVLIELCRLSIAASAYQSESIGDYSYTLAAPGPAVTRRALVRELLPLRGPGTIRLHSSLRHGRVGEVTVAE